MNAEKNYKTINRSCQVPYYHLNSLSLEFSEVVVGSKRVSKVTSGGVTSSISMTVAIVAVGEYKKQSGIFFGYGTGKSKNSADARNKAINASKSSILFAPTKDGNFQYRGNASYKNCKIVVIPGKKGAGISSGGAISKVFQAISSLDGRFSAGSKIITGGGSPGNELITLSKFLSSAKTTAYYLALRNENSIAL